MIRALRVAVCLASVLLAKSALAADQWIEVKSANFTVMSNAGDRSTRRLVWQLEQMRSAMAALWTWAKPDLIKPLTIVAVKDENGMRAMAPQYWEQRGGVRPASVWVSGVDRHYLVVRADVEVDSQGTNNPLISAYFSYVGLILDQSLDRDLPFWFRRGFTGVLSNTMVRDDRILLGAPIAWELRTLRERPRLRVAELLQVRRNSPQLKQADFMETYDAQTWALVHFLLFSNDGKRAPALDTFIRSVSDGKDPGVAFTEAFGSVELVESPFVHYIQQSVFSYRMVKIDLSVERERFPIRQLTVAESASTRALLHAAMRRPVESRAAIADARKADPNAADTYAAEGLLFDAEKKADEASTAFTKAGELGTTNAYVYYRLAMAAWKPAPTREDLDRMEAFLMKAIGHNTRYAAAHAWLGQIRASRGNEAGLGFIRRAIALDPREPNHRLRAAQVLLAQGKPSEARADAQAALMLAEDDDDRREAQALLDRISKAQPQK